MKPLVFLALCVLVTPLFGAPAMAAKDPIELYTRSSYTYCDAKVLAAHWGQSVWDAKTRIGKKIGLSRAKKKGGNVGTSSPASTP